MIQMASLYKLGRCVSEVTASCHISWSPETHAFQGSLAAGALRAARTSTPEAI